MKRLFFCGFAIVAFACGNDHAEPAIAAARAFTKRYEGLNLKAHAAGTDCQVLLIASDTVLDSTTVESIQYGVGHANAYEGGADRFAEDRRFRAVVYRDRDNGLWTYGATTREEAASLPLCR